MRTMPTAPRQDSTGAPCRETLRSGDVSVAVDWFGGAQDPGQPAARRPAVLMLHGADGLVHAERYRSGARLIAAEGTHVGLLHYLDRTGEQRASYARIAAHFEPWLATLSDAVTWLQARPDVDSDRIGLVGISLGGSLALAAASRDPRIKAVVDYFGPLPVPAMRGGALPPTLVLHGADDPIVPVAHAAAVEALLKDRGAVCEIKIYPGQGHGFYGAALADANARVAAFLDRHLHGGGAAPALSRSARPG